MKILHTVGARPNFIKVAPVMAALGRHDCFQQVLVHTGQHNSYEMSQVFFEELDIPKPDYNLGVNGDSIASQISRIMPLFENVLDKEKPDWVFVYGDVNSTLACALVTAHKQIKLAHIEAGLRSFDPTMPEEINRVLVDRISTLKFVSCQDACDNLCSEGESFDSIKLVGNVMIDSLKKIKLNGSKTKSKNHILVTLHRPSNVDNPKKLFLLMRALDEIAIEHRLKVIFPMHPRTSRIKCGAGQRVEIIPPQSYKHFVSLMAFAKLVITDSGGVQEETSFLGVPCLTLRNNTERPVTTRLGTNRLVRDSDDLRECVRKELSHGGKTVTYMPFWDGLASERIVETMLQLQ